MKLIYSVPSPYARKARVVLIEARLEGRVETEAIDPWSDPPGFRDDNPLGKVPALIRDDGAALFQSNIVCEYLNAEGGAQLYPAEGADRWTALRQLALADGILDAAVTVRMELTFHEPNALSQKRIDRQELSVARAIAALESEAAALEGPVTIGQIAVACALGYRDFRFADIDWRTGHPQLASWFATFAERPSMTATNPAA
ncbi:MAG: glutathione S-transferase [Alphaproteobacteria bacterium]|nr:glutathione S-transferase [Alphaproteobacteria bacterium]